MEFNAKTIMSDKDWKVFLKKINIEVIIIGLFLKNENISSNNKSNLLSDFKNKKKRVKYQKSIVNEIGAPFINCQESIAAPLSVLFRNKIYEVLSSHRAHAHYLGKGGNYLNYF